jgi:cytochrome c oxidase subunit I
MASVAELYEAAQPIHHEPTSFWRKHVFSIDHKVIGRQFLWARSR